MPSENAYVCLFVQHTETDNPNFRLSDNYRIIADPQKAKTTAEKLVKQLHQEYPDKRVIMQTEAINDDFSQEAPKNEQEENIYEFIELLDKLNVKPIDSGEKNLMLNIIVQNPETNRLITQVMVFAVPIEK